MRRFVIIGRTAHASERALLEDLPGKSGRLDVLLRCIRAALLTSHGLRTDVVVYLVLLGDARPYTVRIDGAQAKFLRPDDRQLAILLKKTIARVAHDHAGFEAQRFGVSVACAGLDAALADVREARPFILEEGAPDVRACSAAELTGDVVFFIGDHLGFDEPSRAAILATGAQPIAVGPVSLHSDDVVTLLSNEIDRHEAMA